MTTKRRLISHSEVDSLNQCEMKHHFAHEEKLQAVRHGEALNAGNSGHEFFRVFFTGIKDGMETEAARDLALSTMMTQYGDTPAVAVCIKWVTEVWPTLGWKIVAVEQQYRVAISDTLVFPFKFDLLVEINGELVVVDHKFVYDPYSQELIDLLPQIPKYIVGLKQHGLDVKYGIYNMLRTRKTSIDVLLRRETHPNTARLKQSMAEQIQGMKRIEAGIPKPMRTVNKMNCNNCQFARLCTQELNGDDTTLLRENFFEPNDYGYEDD